MSSFSLPRTQGQLIKTARADRTQRQFAMDLGVDRTCLSRYENEQLGAPTAVLNYCLAAVASLAERDTAAWTPVQRALAHARVTVAELEVASTASSGNAAENNKASAGG